jgi:hypothetical protein
LLYRRRNESSEDRKICNLHRIGEVHPLHLLSRDS